MYITISLIIITCVVSVIIFSRPQQKYQLTFSPYKLKHHKEWYRAFTHMFIHADWLHLIFNMYVLYAFGPAVFDKLSLEYGSLAYLYFIIIYIGGGLFATLPSTYKHNENDLYHSLGASGAVFSVVFASVLFYPTSQMGFFFFPSIPAFIFGPILLIIEFYLNKRRSSNVAHDAHLGGAVFGIVFLCILNYRFAVDFYEVVKFTITSWF